MTALEVCFWLAAALVAYAYLLYPLGVGLLARLLGRPARPDGPFMGSVSIVLAAYNEEPRVARRLEELTGLLAASGRPGEILVVCDGCSDATADLAMSFTKGPVRVLEFPDNAGKAVALNRGCADARHDVIVFADARQHWAPDALEKLLRNFADPRVGAVSGDLVVESGPGVLAGVGLYWRYEKWLRHQEGLLHSTVGVTGAISAVRRSLFRPIPPRTVLDDVYWPLGVVLQGYRVVHEKEARAYDRLPDSPRDEFRRKVRTLSGNFQLLSRLPAALVPWRNPVWVQLVSHKFLRLLVPWALLLLLALSAVLPGRGYWLFFVAQVAGYGLGLASIWSSGRPSRPSSAAASFLTLNAAAWLAFWVWASGKAARSWSKVFYRPGPAPPPGPVDIPRSHAL
jgi:cellulose synthase/poly-beta-1,6-N-acetylglucosamine synthase-like glycosyltransferase